MTIDVFPHRRAADRRKLPEKKIDGKDIWPC